LKRHFTLSRDQTKEVSTKQCCSVPSYGGGRGRHRYKSNVCCSVKDAAFEIKYWIEEDMSQLIDKMKVGHTWTASVKGGT
jgi:hypothetical protein